MSDINSRVVSKHCLKFKDDVKNKDSFLDMGFVHMVPAAATHSSGTITGLIPSDIRLFSSKIARVSDIIPTVQYDFASCEHCFLICKGKGYDNGNQITAFISYLRDNSSKAAVIVINEQTRRKAYMTCMSREEEASMGGFEGFKVHFPDTALSKQHSAGDHGTAWGGEAKVDFTFKPLPISYGSANADYGTAATATAASSSAAAAVPGGNKRGYEQAMAADHYGAVVRNRSSRHTSMIYHLRELNNWVKTALITTIFDMYPRRYCKGPVSVLDVGCGKGGDIDKWLRCKSSKGVERYVGVDIALKSLQHFVSERLILQSASDRRKFTKLVCADLGVDSLTSSTLETYVVTSETIASSGASKDELGSKVIGKWCSIAGPMAESEKFDIMSCQFALHYFFQTRQKCSTFFSNVRNHLKDGRHFITSTIDSRRMADLLLRHICTVDGSDTPTKELRIANSFGDVLLRVTFNDYHWKRLLSYNSSFYDSSIATTSGSSELTDDAFDALFGIQYDFVLGDNEDEQAVNAPEWIVPSGKFLEHIAGLFGLKVTYYENNHKFISERIRAAEIFPTPSNLFLKKQLESRNAFNYKGKIEDAEWDICGLYAIIVFEKIGSTEGGEEEEEELDVGGEVRGFATPEGTPPSTPPYSYYPCTPPYAPP